MSNYYVKAQVSNEVVKLPIEEDNVFTICPRCGREFAVDLAELAESDLGLELYGTAVYCTSCSTALKEERQAGNVVPLKR